MIIALCCVSEGTMKKGIVDFPEVQSSGKQWGLNTGLIATKTVTDSRPSLGFAVDSEDGTNRVKWNKDQKEWLSSYSMKEWAKP